MDNQTPNMPIVDSPQSTEAQPSTSRFLVILLSILLVISVSIAGFFAYQTQTLVKELTLLKSSSFPVSSAEPTLDPTADWKTYTNSKIGASIKYPSDWVIKEDSNGVSVNFDTNMLSPKVVDGNQVNYFFNFQLEDLDNFNSWSSDISSKKLETVKIGDKSFERIIGADMFYTINYIYKTEDGRVVRFYLGPYTSTESKTIIYDVVNQILSTFKFIN